MISFLSDLLIVDKKNYGGKAIILGELFKLGMQVPNGFAISSGVYSEFLNFNNFTYNTEDYLAQNENIIDLILKGNFSAKIIDTLRDYFESLNIGEDKKCFVVRSSAICEDSENYSMAGVFSSYINLTSFSQLIESIKKCYASLFSSKSLSMMARYNIPFKDLKMGIIVQDFVNGSLSGVAFSADTVKMDSEVIIINSVNGICADYVEAKYPSSQYRVSKDTGEIVNSLIPPLAPELSSVELCKLHKEVLFIENSFGNHQDIEWTMKDSILYILQARPITTFRSCNYPESWFKHDNLNDTLLLADDKILTPLQQDIKILWHNAACKGWEYSSKGRNGRFKICNGYFFDAVDERDWDKRAKFRGWLEVLFTEGKNIFQDLQLPQIISLREELNTLFHNEKNSWDLRKVLSKSIKLFELSVEIHKSAVDGGTIPLEAFEKYCRNIDSGLTNDDFYDLVYGISKLSEERQTIIDLSILVKASTELMILFNIYLYDEVLYHHLKSYDNGQELLRGIDEYLEEYGLMSANGQWQLDSPIMLEKPWYVIGKIRSCIDIDSDLFFRTRQESLKNKKSVMEKLTVNMSFTDKVEFLTRLKGAEKSFLVNDDHCFYPDLSAIGYLRLVLIEIANLFKDLGEIEKNEDIDFLTFDEIKDLLKMIQDCNLDIKQQDLINKRKIDYTRQSRIIPPAFIGIPPALKAPEIQNLKDELSILKGISGLQKKITGKVKVITDNSDIHLNEDVILVLKHGHSCYFLPFIGKIKD